MTTHTLTTSLWLPVGRDEVFSFFADAFNLQAITPPWLKFSVQTPRPIAMHTGALIDYHLRVRGLPLRWQSEITLWDPPFCFVDEQRRGPYRSWIHEHSFEAIGGGTLCRDEVHYALPGGPLINWLLVRRDVEQIFAFRQKFLRSHFCAGVSASPLDFTRPGRMAATNSSP